LPGRLDATPGCVDWSIFGFLDPRLSAVSAPFLVDTLKGANDMTKRLLPLHDALFQEKFNARALGMFSVDGLIIVSSKPVKTVNDWKGLLAGVSAPPSAALFKGLGASYGYMINQDVWKKMPPSIQKILQEEVDRTRKYMEDLFLKLTDEDLAVLREKGKKVYAAPKAEREKWAALLIPYREKELASLGDFGQKVKQAADEANKRFPYVAQIVK
jgi:TRAP-type C4-dicarboxylate transport system substrate-binding protein